MKILKKAMTPGGIQIQLEDWSEDFPGTFQFGATIAAYPRKYMRRRAAIDFQHHQDALSVFDALQNGNKGVMDVNFLVMEAGGNHVPLKPILERCIKRYNA